MKLLGAKKPESKPALIFDESLSGAHILNKDKMCSGNLLYEGKLIDRGGTVIKSWPYKYLGTILQNGDYLAQEKYESLRWGRFTGGGKKIWIKEVPIHHDICIRSNGNIITATKEMHEYKKRKVDFCVLVEYNPDGNEVWRWSTWEHLEELKKLHGTLELEMPKVLGFDSLKAKPTTIWGGNFDYYRINSICVLPKNPHKDPRFKEGNIMFSARHGSMIFVLNGDEIVWSITQKDVPGEIQGQHAVSMLENGNLLIFDNGRYRGQSRIIELDPLSLKIKWEWTDPDFYTLSQGYVQRLPNGNTLITESEKGHAFEIDSQGKKVWEFYHPERQNKENQPEHPESWGSRQWIYRMKWYDLDM